MLCMGGGGPPRLEIEALRPPVMWVARSFHGSMFAERHREDLALALAQEGEFHLLADTGLVNKRL